MRSPLRRSPASPRPSRAGRAAAGPLVHQAGRAAAGPLVHQADRTAARPPRTAGAGRRRPPQPWIVTGLDLSAPAPPRRRFTWPRPAALGTLAAGAVCAALLLVSLRMDSIRLRYALADAVRVEQELLDQQRRLTVQVRHLRDPRRLEALAGELGIAPAACVIDLDAPRPCPEPSL